MKRKVFLIVIVFLFNIIWVNAINVTNSLTSHYNIIIVTKKNNSLINNTTGNIVDDLDVNTDNLLVCINQSSSSSSCTNYVALKNYSGMEKNEDIYILPYIISAGTLPYKGSTYNVYVHVKDSIGSIAKDSGSYTLYDNILSAINYGTPQIRERYFLVAIKGKYLYHFPEKIKLKVRLKDLIEKEIDKDLILSEKVPFNLQEFVENKNYTKQNKLLLKNVKDNKLRYEINLYRFIDGKNFCGSDLLSKFTQSSRLWSINGFSPTLTANSTEDMCKMIIYKDNCFFVKRISPLESWRIMGFTDEDYYKAKNIGTSKRQLFKQAGNSIATNVIYYILKNLL